MEIKMNIKEKIISAIKTRKKVELNYKREGNRLVCPHALYISPTGKTLVDGYQLAGYSSHSEQIPGWRPFDISKITDLKVLDEAFELAHGYNPHSDRYLKVIVKV